MKRSKLLLMGGNKMVHTFGCFRRHARSTWTCTNFKRTMLAAATSALTLGAASPAFGQCSCMPADPCPAGCVGASVGMDYHACKPGTTFVAGQINWPVVAGEQVQYAVQLSRPSPGMECNFHNGQVRLFFPGIAVPVLVAGYPTETSPPAVPDVAAG